MSNSFRDYAADHRYLLDVAAQQAGLTAPVAVDLDEYYWKLLKVSTRDEFVPIDGVMVRDWSPTSRHHCPLRLGMRVHEVEGIRFAAVLAQYSDYAAHDGLAFAVVDRKDYQRLYRIARRRRREVEKPNLPPVLPEEQVGVLWKNTIGYLDRARLKEIRAYGGRPRRGVLLTGAPGNGKTMACRWIWEECRRRNWEWRVVTPDTYRAARRSCNPQEQVKALFTVERCGIVFFDDMDLALRDRETVQETDDQAVFLGAMDGLNVTEGVVFVFTTNCGLELIDRAFKRPGRLDVVLHFEAPDAPLRRQLMEGWHEDIRGGIDLAQAVASTDGYSFAEIEELKNLLIMHFMDSGQWNWGWALKQFEINREDLAARHQRRVGFGVEDSMLSLAGGED